MILVVFAGFYFVCPKIQAIMTKKSELNDKKITVANLKTAVENSKKKKTAS